LLGDMRDTLPHAETQLGNRVALAHLDAATGDTAAGKRLADELIPLILPLLRPGAILVSEPAAIIDELSPLALPGGVAPGRYHLYRRISRRSTP
jgi:hypothetical protein